MVKLPRFEALLRWGLLGTTLVLPCLLGFITTYVLLILAVAALVYQLLSGLRGERKLRLDSTGGFLLFGWIGLAAVILVDALASGRPNDVVYALDFGMLLLYAPIASLEGRAAGPGGAARVADLALAGTVVAAVVAIAEEVIYHPDRTGFIANDPIRFGDTALILGFLALIGVAAHAGPRRWIYLAGPVLATLVDLLSGARSSLVALPVLAVLAAVFLVRRGIAAVVIGAGALVLFGAMMGVALLTHASRIVSLFEIGRSALGDGNLADEATRERLALYKAGLQAFWNSPWLGFGWHRRMEAVTAALPDADKGLGQLPHLHNEVLNFAVGAGVVGVLLYLLLLAAPLVGVLRSPRDSQFRLRLYGIALLLASYVVLGIADVMLGFETHTALFVAFAAVLLSYCRDEPA